MRDPRSSYEASILLVPTDSTAEAVIDDMGDAGLVGVARLDALPSDRDGHRYRVFGLGGGWAADRPTSESIDGVMEGADVVVLVGADLKATEIDHIAAVAGAARAAGDLLAGLVVGVPGEDDAARRSLMALREQVDMLVNVRTLGLATNFVDVLRGGRRESPEGTAP